MAIVRISSADDPRLAPYRELLEPGRTRARNLFVAEGRLVVRRLLEETRLQVRSLLLSASAAAALADALSHVDAGIPVYVCPVEWFEPITGFHLHRGCLAIAERPQDHDWEAVARTARTVVVLDGVSNPDNVGGMFRNAAAFGIDAVLLSPACGDPFYRKAVRTSMGAVMCVPHARLPEWPGAMVTLGALGFTRLALTPREPSDQLAEWLRQASPARWALIVGAEGPGLTAAVEDLADHRLKIPISPEVDSLNVTVAAGIALAALSGALSRTDPRAGGR